MLCQGPKQYKGLKSRKKKRKKKAFGFLIKKKEGGGRPKSMDGQALDLTKKKGKKNSNPAFKGQEKSLGSLRRKLDQDTWGFLGAWDPRDVQ